MLPTFAELGGAKLPRGVKLDGASIAPLILGKVKTSPRKWIMSLGHGAAKLDQKGVHGATPYVSRVIRDRRFKAWVSTEGKIDQLYDMKNDPYEKVNLFKKKRENQSEASLALKKFRHVLKSIPDRDARPRYTPRAANPWDRKPGGRRKK